MSQVQELIEYIERQRDVYKASVERLLSKLDPSRRRLEDSLLGREEDLGVDLARSEAEPVTKKRPELPPSSGRRRQQPSSPLSGARAEDPGMRTLRDIQEGSRRVIRESQQAKRTPTRANGGRAKIIKQARGFFSPFLSHVLGNNLRLVFGFFLFQVTTP